MNNANQGIEMLGKQFSCFQKKMSEQMENGEKTTVDLFMELKAEMDKVQKDCMFRSNKYQNHLAVELYRLQKDYLDKKDKLRNKIDSKKIQNKRMKEEFDVMESTIYTGFMMDFAMLMIDEATMAFYEATKKIEEYEEKYSEGGLYE